MIGNAKVIQWLAHRTGIRRVANPPIRSLREALELNVSGRPFSAAFGQTEIRGFIGFVDLVGFSERVKGRTAREISDYLKPFLQGMVDLATGRHALVDKTIGDEVMFVLPDMGEDGGPPAHLLMGQLLGGMCDLQRDLGAEYPFRIGLAYGRLYVDQIKGEGYSEWTIVGEVVHLAKRLLELEGVKTELGIGGAFGMLIRDAEFISYFEAILGTIAGFASRMTHRVVAEPVSNLKGVSQACCALLLPKL